ncbi:stage III sporulation protein AF [Anaerotruncus rubiinfantis]|uniref:stage III sporulation protein AF n=1 Tax=Anaerotruncus rubiinfantis TaxID=1720200 RepID=UPI0034A3CDF7
MESIRQWAFGICAAAIACGLAQLILPKSNMQRLFNITSSVFFLSCLLSPLALAPISLDLESAEEMQREVQRRAKNLTSAVEEQTGEIASESIRIAAADRLAEMGIEYQKIYVNIHADDENGISISECEVELDESYLPRHDEIRTALMERLGVNVLIGYQKE